MIEALTGRYLYIIRAERVSASRPAYWIEECILVSSVIRVDRKGKYGAGKTGKGGLHVWAPQYRAIDIEDIVSVTPYPVKVQN